MNMCNYKNSKNLMETGEQFKNGSSLKSLMKQKSKISIVIWGITAILYGCNLTNDTLIPIQTGAKWGYINLKGEYVINPQFDSAEPFLNGLAKVQSSDGKTGYIDEKGQYVIPAIYKDGTNFSDGLAFVVLEGGFPICIDQKGNTIFEMKGAEIVFEFSEGLAMFVNDSEKFGFVDQTGNTVINPQFDEVGFFSEGNPQFEDIKSDNSELNFVISDYYDASEFIKQFFEKDAGSSFDGINVSTSLQNLVDHRKYRGKLNAVDSHCVVYEGETALTKDISIDHVLFYFNRPLEDRWEEYDFKVKTVAIEYKFNLDQKAEGKGSAVAMAMKSDLERRYQRQMEFIESNYVLFGDNDKLSFTISYDTDNVSLLVGLKTEKWDCGDNGSNVTATLTGGNLYIRGTGAMQDFPYQILDHGGTVPGQYYFTPWIEKDYYMVIINSGVTNISIGAFDHNPYLTSIIIPNSVRDIEGYLVLWVDNFTIINHAITPQKVDFFTFKYNNLIECTLFVPAASVYAYRTAEGWEDFGRIEAIPSN